MATEEVSSRDLFLTALVVSFFGLLTVGFLVFPSGIAPAHSTNVRNEKVIVDARGPQSIPLTDTIDQIDVGCVTPKIDKPEKMRVNGVVRLVGKWCLGKMESTDFRIRLTNSTNGFSATLFELEDGRFTTDIIELKPGLNELQFDWKDAKGDTSTAKLTIERD